MPLLIIKLTKTFPKKTTSEYDEALLLLKLCLPENINGLWIRSDGIVEFFKRGGLDLPSWFVSRALKSNQNNSRRWAKNKFYAKWHCCFAGKNALVYASPKDQRDILKIQKRAQFVSQYLTDTSLISG